LKPVKKLIVRPAHVSEREALEALQWRASLKNAGDRDALLTHQDAIQLPRQQIEDDRVFVAEVAGSVKGFAAMLPRDDGDVELDALFVEPEAWGQGIGRALVEYCVQRASTTDACSLRVVGNPHAEGFYDVCGFKKYGVTQTRFGVDLLMKRDLR
jgi:GNAT superfamily N-acetyltransferase